MCLSCLSLDANVGLLTNYEVLQHIKALNQHSYDRHQQQIATLKSSLAHTDSDTWPNASVGKRRAEILLKLNLLESKSQSVWLQSSIHDYLSSQPSSHQSAANISNFVVALSEFLRRNNLMLTNSEILQLVNHRPTQLVEIHRIIEECEERLGEADTLAVLDLMQQYMPVPVAASEADEDATMAEQQSMEPSE